MLPLTAFDRIFAKSNVGLFSSCLCLLLIPHSPVARFTLRPLMPPPLCFDGIHTLAYTYTYLLFQVDAVSVDK